MGQAANIFNQKKDAEVKVFDVAATVAAALQTLSKEDQLRVIRMVDKEMNITPPSPPDCFPFNH